MVVVLGDTPNMLQVHENNLYLCRGAFSPHICCVHCVQAGIRVVVVTGDNQATAEAVCRSIGALGEDAGLDSQQLSSLTGMQHMT
jgi:hypothetical protein